MRTIGLLAAAGIGMSVLLAACGQKGPLVLPDAQHPHKRLGLPKPPPPAPPPAAPQPAAPTGAGPASPSGNLDPGASTAAPASPQ